MSDMKHPDDALEGRDLVFVGLIAADLSDVFAIYAKPAAIDFQPYEPDRGLAAVAQTLLAGRPLGANELQALRGGTAAGLTLRIAGQIVTEPDVMVPAKVHVAFRHVGEGGAVHILLALEHAQPNGSRAGEAQQVDQLGQQLTQIRGKYRRVLSALDAYPHPLALFDRANHLVMFNQSYESSMCDGTRKLRPGMSLRDVGRIAIESGKLLDVANDIEASLDHYIAESDPSSPYQDLEFAGDIHQRVIRNQTPEGDNLVIRLDSTELVRQKRAAEAAQDRLLAALNAYPSPFAIYDQMDCLVVWNDAYRESMSDQPDYLQVGMHRNIVAEHAIRAGKFAAAIGKEEEWSSDEHQRKDLAKPVQDLELAGDIHHRLQRSRVENGDLVLLRIDITELVRERRRVERYASQLETANREISYKARHDELTGLNNRRAWSETFAELVKITQVRPSTLAVIALDLDRFKFINDTLGHAAGDQVLIEVAQRISRLAGASDIVARMGGDEFVVLIDEHDEPNRANELAAQILDSLAAPVRLDTGHCRVGASIGVARTPVSAVSDLLVNADVALYKAKETGRNQIAMFTQADLATMRNNRGLADELIRGLENGEFVPFYQPQIDPTTNQVVGLEALARWDHPTLGIRPPADFLDTATELGILERIDQQIFETAITECRTHFADIANPPTLSFNISARRVFADIDEIARRVQSYTGQVSFELLETIFLEEEGQEFIEQIEALRAVGIAIEVDDFGSGRASVVALQRINPDRLKIDGRLTAQVTEDGRGRRLLHAIAEIGHSLGMGVTAEGVETAYQARVLQELGCDRLQGYLFARPMPMKELAIFVAWRDQPQRRALP